MNCLTDQLAVDSESVDKPRQSKYINLPSAEKTWWIALEHQMIDY